MSSQPSTPTPVSSSPSPEAPASGPATSFTAAARGPSVEPTPEDARRAAFETIHGELPGMDPAQLPQFNLVAGHAASVALATAAKVEFLREELVKLSGFDVRCLDKLPVYAKALLHTHYQLAAHYQQVSQLPEHAEEASELRTLLFAQADVLVLKKIFPAALVAKLKEGTGYRDLTDDLGTLVRLYTDHPEALRRGDLVTQAEVNRASQLVELLNLELGARDDSDGTAAALQLTRRRVAALLLRAHDEVRRGVTYLRWYQGDASALVPPLHIAPGRGPGAKETAQVEQTAPVPATPLAKPALPPPPRDPRDNPFIDEEEDPGK